ncbi:MAG TPA: BMP family ABC transporter substrate-binding protein, partial [Spirochaetaceae bacterium]|nr:BMP family ABC transporter substrate-binding protein [Spirochaetaceae bacterium]
MKRFSRLMILGGLILAAAVGISAQPTSRLLTDATGIDDRSFNQAAWMGILNFYGDRWTKTSKRGKFYDVLTAQTQDMYIPNLMQAS